ncbi:Phasin protein [Roseivivax lentus]|uniref:Phasin protein n=1 Tax=Roseivivax lentus TaxID=633194 RepID=A0A1N7NVQ4_9RHOB|nr:phasin family protein [Roseivivax lentus]SIT02378.1 Phasin protein [Roseivivax lentus]
MSAKRQSGASPGDANPFAKLQDAGFGDFMGMSQSWMEAMSRMSAEFVDFIGERLKEDAKLQQELRNCRDLGELQALQIRFTQRAIEQYQAESGKLLEISTSLFEKADETAKKETAN